MKIEHIIRTPPVHKKPTPILLLHGAWHAAWCFDLWMDDFVTYGYEVHSMSLPGHGKSTGGRPLALYGVGNYVKALAQVIDEIKPTPYVVAHAMGGYVLQRYLRKCQLPGAILLCSIPTFGALPYFIRTARKMPLRFLVATLTTNLRLLVGTPELAAATLLTPGSLVSPDKLASQLQNESLQASLELVFSANRAPEQVKTPMLVIAAEKDGIFPVPEEEATARAYGAEYVMIQGQGHDLMIERDALLVAGKIREWIEKMETSRR